MSYIEVYQKKGTNTISYRTGLTVYEETFFNGALCASGWNVAGYPLNVLNGSPTRIDFLKFGEPSTFKLEVDGVNLDYSWNYLGYEKVATDTGIDVRVTLESKIKPIRVIVHTLLDGTCFFDRYLELVNLDNETYHTVNRMELIGGPYEQMGRNGLTAERNIEKYYSIGYFKECAWGREGDFVWEDVKADRRVIDTRFARSRYRHPAFYIRNNVKGTITCIQMAYSGGCRFTVDCKARDEDDQVNISYGAEIVGYNPMLVLRPGETFALPEVVIGTVAGGIDDVTNEMNKHLRKSVLNLEGTESGCLIGAGMGPEHDMLMDTTMNYIDQFHKMGAEIFIIDAGWQCPPVMPIPWFPYNGTNRPNPERYPDNGFVKLREYCHSLGMKFGLWTEIERIGEQSDVYKQHPDWRNKNKFGSQHFGYLDMANPEAAKWAEEEVARIISEYKLDLFRVDYNMDSDDAYFLMKDTEFGVKECATLRNFAAVTKMYQNLKKRFPDVIFENCAGGGGRTDLGQMKAFNHTWVSDWQRAPKSVTITNGMTLVLPPEKCDRLFAGMGCHQFGSLALQMRNTMLGHMSLNVINPPDTTMNEDAVEFITHSVDIYKNFIRKIFPDCLIFHHTPEAANTFKEGFSALEICSPDKKRGALTAFTLTNAKESVYTLYPRGIDPSLTYKVTLDNLRSTFRMTGAELINRGLRLEIPASLSSELVLYEAE